MKISSAQVTSLADLNLDVPLPHGTADFILHINLQDVGETFSFEDLEYIKDEVYSRGQQEIAPAVEASSSDDPFRLRIVVSGVPEQYREAIADEIIVQALHISPSISLEDISIDVV